MRHSSIGHQILVADDSLNVQRQVRDALESAGYSVTLAENGEEAVRLALQSSPDLILADVSMPKLGGIEVCARLKRLPHFAAIPVLFLVGPFDEYDEALARRAGGSGIVPKPVQTTAILEALRRALARPPSTSELTIVEEEDESDRLERLSELPEPALVPPPQPSFGDPWQARHDAEFDARKGRSTISSPWSDTLSKPAARAEEPVNEVMLSVEDVAEVQIDDSEEDIPARPSVSVPGSLALTFQEETTRPAPPPSPIDAARTEQLIREEIRTQLHSLLPTILRETVERVVRERVAILEQRMRGLERGELTPDQVNAEDS